MRNILSQIVLLAFLLALGTATKPIKFKAKLSKKNVNPGKQFALIVNLPKNSPCFKVPAKCKKHPIAAGCPIGESICTLELHLPDGAAYYSHSNPLKADVHGQSDFSSIVDIPLPVAKHGLKKKSYTALTTQKVILIADSCLPPNKLSLIATVKMRQGRGFQSTSNNLKPFQVCK